MGLDAVELIMALEEEFGVSITDDEANRCTTPRMLTDLVFSKVRSADEATCRTQRAFYLLRRSLMQVTGAQRAMIAPDTPLRVLIPEQHATVWWKKLRKAHRGSGWPGLIRPAWLFRILIFPPLIAFAGVIYGIYRTSPRLTKPSWIPAAAVAIICAVAEATATRRFKTHIPSRLQSVRDLIRYVKTSEELKWTRGDVARLVKENVLDHVDVPESKYHEDAHLVKDLGLGK